MNDRAIIIAGIIGLFLAATPVTLAGPIDAIVDQVSQDNYYYYMDTLLYTHLGDNRGFGAEHDLARDNIFDFLGNCGLDPYLDPFTYNGHEYYNVVAVQPGVVRPDEMYIVGAHYDSVNNPGADDNASGVAAVMEAARILSQYKFEATLVFIGFDREEQGLIGSYAYALEHQTDDIQGMVSLDMIAYNNRGHNMATIYGRRASDPIKYALAEAIGLYGNGLGVEVDGEMDGSDHAPFEWLGFDACLLIEEWGNPYYHTEWDSIDMPDYLDFVYATNMTRSAVGYLATAAGLVPEPSLVGFAAAGVLLVVFRLRRRVAN